MKRLMTLLMPVLVSTFALTGCGTTGEIGVSDARKIIGTDLIGVRGATAEDQRKINRTVVGVCAAKVWNKAECTAHGEVINRSTLKTRSDD